LADHRSAKDVMRSRQNSIFAMADAIFSYTHRRKSEMMWESNNYDNDDDDAADASSDPVRPVPARIEAPAGAGSAAHIPAYGDDATRRCR
jgi:hypothetical protein